MSTKTSIKRVALVAVSALGFGLLSVNAAFGAAATASATAPKVSVAGVNSALGTVTFGAITNAAADTYDVAVATGPAGGAFVITNLGGEIIAQPAPILVGASAVTIQGSGTGPAAAATAITGYFTVPGVYTVTWGNTTTSTGTYYVAPSQTSALLAQVITSSTVGSVFKTNVDDPSIAVTRAANTSGTVKLLTVVSADSAVAPGTVLKTSGTPAAFTFSSSDDTIATVFTFDSATSGAFDAAGLYTMRPWIDANANDLIDSGEATASDVSFRIAGAPATYSVSLNPSTISNVNGSTIATVTVTDALGQATYSGGNVAYTDDNTATAADTDANANRVAGTNTYTKIVNFTASGTTTAGASIKITFTDSVVATATASATLTIRDSLATAGTELALSAKTGLFVGTAGTSTFSTTIPSNKTNTAVAVSAETAVKSFTFTFTGTASKSYAVSLSTTGGRDVTRYTYPTTITTLADGTATFIVENSAPVASSTNPDAFTIAVTDSIQTTATYNNVTAGGNITLGSTAGILVGATTNDAELPGTVATVASGTVITMSANTANQNRTGRAVTFSNSFQYTVTYVANQAFWTLSPASTTKVLQKSTNIVTATLKDRFGRVMANQPYTVSVSGRNVSSGSGTTDASGVATYTVTDTATSSYDLTLGYPTDTVTFTSVVKLKADGTTDVAASAATGVSFSYVATLPAVDTVVVTSPASIPAIDQVLADPTAPTTVTYTATARLATGAAAGSGILVTFSGDADDIFLNGIKTAVTDVNGQATIKVYRSKVGYQVIKATAGDKSGTSTANLWSNDGGAIAADGTGTQGGHDGRKVAVSAAQSVVGGSAATVIATVTDRWGNPVSGVLVTWSYSGVGRPVSGADATVGTDTNGQAQFQVTALSSETGAMNVTATISGGQSADLAGYVAGTAVTGVTAGNTKATSAVTFTKDTSVSTADALLELAKAIGTGKEVEAATDAAAEAIDAANAATDAANLAAEAADAATVAAEEARDAADAATAAVEELATQVASLMSALKAQLTTLANTVAKIAKKVKA